MHKDFVEIAHSGGTVTFSIHAPDGPTGKLTYQIALRHTRPVPVVMFGVYAISQGVPVSELQLGGIGELEGPPPFPGCVPVYISSDSTGHFGHRCPRCDQYWRSGPLARVCPYCGLHGDTVSFLSDAQRQYIKHYCALLSQALRAGTSTDVVMDMDAVADAVGTTGPKPSFYVAEESQQHKFTCPQCDEFNDIIGRSGFCSLCGSRNDLATFEADVSAIRNQLNSGAVAPEHSLQTAVSAFDSTLAQYAKQLTIHVPLSKARRQRLARRKFHDFSEVVTTFESYFDISLAAGVPDDERSAAQLLFHRRHVYEHNGGEVDQRYIDASGDKTVRLKQRISEEPERIHDFLNTLVKVVRNLHAGFHELLPARQAPIDAYAKRKARTTGAE